jgi:Zn-dependent protease with chaperone function
MEPTGGPKGIRSGRWRAWLGAALLAVAGQASLARPRATVPENAAELSRRREMAQAILLQLFDALREGQAGARRLRLPRLVLGRERDTSAYSAWESNTIVINQGIFEIAASKEDREPDVVAAVLAHELGHIYLRHLPPRFRRGASSAAREATRGQERAADLFGARLACQAGFDPRGAVHLLQTLSGLDREGAGAEDDHPSYQERIQYLKQEARQCR